MRTYRMFMCLVLLTALPVIHGRHVTAQTVQDSVSAAQDTVTQKTGDTIRDTIEQTRPKIAWSVNVAKILWSVIIFFIALIALKYVTIVLEAFAEHRTNLRLLIKRVIPIIRIIGWTFVIYVIIFEIFAPPIETLVAVTASAGIAIGFASQDILKNIFGGITILLDRPFQVGDKIQVGEHYGEVVQIGMRSVRVVTPDDSLVTIPNSNIVNQSVSNANSGEFNCQVVSEFYLPPGIDLVKLKKIAYRAAAVSQYVYLNKPIVIIIKNEVYQGRSLLKVRLKAYVLDLRYEFPFASEMTEIVMSELLKQKLVTVSDLAFGGCYNVSA
ncbi:mechanosensitive ion channel family protein [bacterium]|nr:mechanosensitive ion channel family protein [bacterium]